MKRIFKALLEAMEYREVLSNLISTTLAMRYKNSTLGFLWSFLNPLFTMIVTAVVFSMLFRFKIENYALFIFSGLLPWGFIVTSVTMGSASIITAESYIKKVYLPKIIFPMQVIGSELINFGLSILVLYFIGAFIGIKISVATLFLPIALVNLILFSFGLSLISAVATVFFRDMTHIVTITTNAMFYLCPVIYPMSMVPKEYQHFYDWNPVVYLLKIFRSAIYHHEAPTLSELGIAFGISFITCLIGLVVFIKAEKKLIYRL
ncbi:MAG: ABC transporter permease [Halobacteriovoraceae bacterium]|jgi:ABC-type polysaccharide/polyol phosphate export permease|nr:ABC transporter permease [Halobacteriovoraceae bacterium]